MGNITSILGSKQSIIFFALSLITLTFWYIGLSIDIYQYAIVGAIFEILWLPMLVFLFVLPLLSLFFWIKEKMSLKSLYLYSFLIGILTFIVAQYISQSVF